MSFFEKLDELITKLDEADKEQTITDSEQTITNINDINNVIEAITVGETGAEVEQETIPEDAATNESVEKLSGIVIKQQEHIERLQKQISNLVNYSGANINDGKQIPIVKQESNVPEEYTPLRDMDFNFKY